MNPGAGTTRYPSGAERQANVTCEETLVADGAGGDTVLPRQHVAVHPRRPATASAVLRRSGD